MALKPCRECSEKVSTKAATCPNCGMKHPTRRPDYFIGICTIVFVVVVVAAAGGHDHNIQTETAPNIPHEAQAAYDHAEAAFYGCAKYRAKSQNLPASP